MLKVYWLARSTYVLGLSPCYIQTFFVRTCHSNKIVPCQQTLKKKNCNLCEAAWCNSRLEIAKFGVKIDLCHIEIVSVPVRSSDFIRVTRVGGNFKTLSATSKGVGPTIVSNFEPLVNEEGINWLVQNCPVTGTKNECRL